VVGGEPRRLAQPRPAWRYWQPSSARTGAHITDVNAGHLSMISRANTVTKVIIDAANATG